MRARLERRGQATVELALGSLLFVTILTFGIYFGETNMLILKVQEAGAFSLWDATGRRVHYFNGPNADYSAFGTLPGTVAGQVDARYQDFEGLGSATRTGVEKARAKGVSLTATCQRFNGAGNNFTFNVVDPGGLFNPVFPQLRALYQNNTGGLGCQVTAQLSVLHLPQFLESGATGFFKEAQVRRPTMNVCATRWCTGKLGILLGTWAVEGPLGDVNNNQQPLGAANNAPTPCTGNPAYCGMVQRLFNANGRGKGNAAHAFAKQVGNEPATPDNYNVNTFFMSYRGIEDSYSEPIRGWQGRYNAFGRLATPQTRDYDTNGAPLEPANRDVWTWMDKTKAARRTNFFLGLPKLAP